MVYFPAGAFAGGSTSVGFAVVFNPFMREL